jgi:hypothetical protein
MKTIIRWYLPWFALFALIYLLCGCDAEGVPPGVEMPDAAAGVEAPAVPFHGPRAGLDAGSAPDVERTPDAVPVVPGTDAEPGTDAVPVAPKPDAGVGVGIEVSTPPSCPVVTAQPPPTGSPSDLRWSVTVQAASTDAFCFKTCDTPIWAMSWKSLNGRTVTVNGTELVFFSTLPNTLCYSYPCAGDLSNGGSEAPYLPPRRDQGYTFQISAGPSASTAITLFSGSATCP